MEATAVVAAARGVVYFCYWLFERDWTESRP